MTGDKTPGSERFGKHLANVLICFINCFKRMPACKGRERLEEGSKGSTD